MSALAHTFALGACVLSFLAYRLSIMADLLGRNLLCSRLSSCLFQTCWHLAGPHAPNDLARFKQLLSIIFSKLFFHVFNFSNRLSSCLFQTCWHLVGPRAHWPSTLQTMDGPRVLLLRHCAINWITSPIGLHGVGIARVSCISSNQSKEITHGIPILKN